MKIPAHSLKRLFCFADELASRRQFTLATIVVMFSALPFLSVIDAPQQGDVYIYHAVASDISNGKLPYRDTLLEYPPYAIPLFVLPAVLGDENYMICFSLLAVIADATIKCLLLGIGLREAKGIRSLLPLAAYCVATPFIKYFFLQRYDVFPALLSLLALWFFSSRKYTLSGLMIALGTGLKLYPVLFAPPLFFLAWRERQARQFLIGLLGGGMPILLLGVFLPWWRFLAFHSERGLQAESLYASILWFAHLLGITDAAWEGGKRCLEVHGALADLILPWSRASLVLVVGISVGLVCWSAVRSKELKLPQLARLLVAPLLAFVIFNQVFSPQFMIWLLPLAAIAGLSGNPWITMAIPLATMLTPVFYPSPEYHSGLNLFETQVLIARNFILVGVWIFLMREILLQSRRAKRIGIPVLVQGTERISS